MNPDSATLHRVPLIDNRHPGGAAPRPPAAGRACCAVAWADPRPGRARRCSPCSSLTALLYLWGLSASGYANSFYSAAAQAGLGVLEGVLLRLLRRRQLDHRRQDPAGAVADGALGSSLRAVVLEHPRSAGHRGRARGRAARRDRTPQHRLGGGRSDLRAVLAIDPGRGADVQVQQPRRDAGPAARSRPVHATLRAVESTRVESAAPGALAGPRRCPGRVRVPGQAAPGLPGAARAGAGLPGRRARPASASGSDTCWSPSPP